MTFDDPDRRRRHHRTQRGFGRARSHGDTPSQGSDPVPGKGADTDGEPDSAQPLQPRPKQLSREAQRRLQAARLWIAANRPYYSKALFSCPVIPAAAPARVGIDERWRIYANSEFLESLTVERAAVELIHVLNHALRDHAQRARNASVDAMTVPVWNAAADCEINDDLCEDDLIEDDDWLFPETLGMDEFMPAEHYYRHLLDNGVPVQVHLECGSGCHSHHVDHELDADTEALSGLRPHAAQARRRRRGRRPPEGPRHRKRARRPRPMGPADTAPQSQLAPAVRVGAALQRAPQDRNSRLHLAAPLAPPTAPRPRAAAGHDPPRAVHRRRRGHLRIHG